jgi:hypothetical protein
MAMKKIKATTYATKARALIAVSLITALLVCLPGCTNKGWQASPIPSSTTQSSGTPPSSSKSTTSMHTTRPAIRPEFPIPATTNNRTTLTDMLEVIPDSLATLSYVNYVNFVAWREVQGIKLDRYTDTGGYLIQDGENTYVNDLLFNPGGEYSTIPHGTAPFVSGMGPANPYMLHSPVRITNTGYGPLQVEQSIIAESYPGENKIIKYEAINGNFDLMAINQATDNYFNPYSLPLISEYDNIDLYSWDGEMRLERRFSPPIFDNLGQGRTLAIQKNRIFGSTLIDYVYEMIGTSRGRVNSLAGNPTYQVMADNLEKMGAMSAIMSCAILSYDKYLEILGISGSTPDPNMVELFENAGKDAPLMETYTAFASGIGKDVEGLFVIIVLTYENAETPKGNIETLKNRLAACRNYEDKPYAEEIDSSEVWAEGTALCATLRGNVITYWNRFIWTEPLLMSD